MLSLDTIQQADRKTRVRWLIILSSLSGVFVLIIWIGGIKHITSSVAAPQESSSSMMFSSISTTFKQGFSDFKNGISNTIHYFKEKTSQPPLELTPTTTTSTSQ